MYISTSSTLLVFLGCLIASSYASPSGPVLLRQVRQAKDSGNRANTVQEFPVKIAGGQNGFRPSVGTLSSRPVFESLTAGGRFEAPPPVVFGPRPRPRPTPRPQQFRPFYFRPWYQRF